MEQHMGIIEQFMKPHLENFCQQVSLDDLVRAVEEDEDVYPIWVDQFSEGQRPPRIAILFQGEIRRQVKQLLAETCPEHFSVFDANPTWSERQLDGLFEKLFA